MTCEWSISFYVVNRLQLTKKLYTFCCLTNFVLSMLNESMLNESLLPAEGQGASVNV